MVEPTLISPGKLVEQTLISPPEGKTVREKLKFSPPEFPPRGKPVEQTLILPEQTLFSPPRQSPKIPADIRYPP